MLSNIVPPNVETCEKIGDFADCFLLAEEQVSLGRCAQRRLQEFAAGRDCATAALKRLGYPRCPLLRGASREPLWPSGVVGSISHCEGYCAAAVASTATVETIGIDGEVNRPLPEGVLKLIAFDEEITMLSHLPPDGVCWDRLLFSAKESLFKAWYPIERQWLGFEDARATVLPQNRTVWAKVLRPSSSDSLRHVLTGTFAWNREHIVTALVVEARSGVNRSGAGS
jgi:4'-phosphopantetheinyl transferase EntD